MSVKSRSGSESSPEDNKLCISASPSFVRERDEKGWKTYANSSSELMTTASAIFSNHSSEEDINSHASFLYDYYGMTEETRQEPPSPGHSPVTSPEDNDAERFRDKEANGIDIPISVKESDSPVIEMRHSFPESGKSHFPIYTTQSNESSLHKKSYVASMPSISKVAQSISQISSSTAPDSEFNTANLAYMDNVELNLKKYRYTLEAQTSLVQKRGEDSLTYLNKGQFYYITSEAFGPKPKRVKSVIHLVFRNEKDPNIELTHWKYWYNQQPNPNQRALDIDMKACQSIEDVEEVGHNALAFFWDPSIGSKVSLRINCLSTDFSPQKGVKGIPLHLQVDTFEDWNELHYTDPVHRAFCQIKVFRDKGAERKNKDESKTVSKRMVKYLKGSDTSPDVSHVFQDAYKVTYLYPTSNLEKSVIFVPAKDKERTKSTDSTGSSGSSFFSQLKEREKKRGFNVALSNAKEDLEHLDVLPRPKAPRVLPKTEPAVTIYVRKEEEKAYNALMLETLTLEELKKSISFKYSIPEEMIKHVFKKTKKGILVYLDDRLIELFVNEDDFLISITFDNQRGHFEVIFNC